MLKSTEFPQTRASSLSFAEFIAMFPSSCSILTCSGHTVVTSLRH